MKNSIDSPSAKAGSSIENKERVLAVPRSMKRIGAWLVAGLAVYLAPAEVSAQNHQQQRPNIEVATTNSDHAETQLLIHDLLSGESSQRAPSFVDHDVIETAREVFVPNEGDEDSSDAFFLFAPQAHIRPSAAYSEYRTVSSNHDVASNVHGSRGSVRTMLKTILDHRPDAVFAIERQDSQLIHQSGTNRTDDESSEVIYRYRAAVSVANPHRAEAGAFRRSVEVVAEGRGSTDNAAVVAALMRSNEHPCYENSEEFRYQTRPSSAASHQNQPSERLYEIDHTQSSLVENINIISVNRQSDGSYVANVRYDIIEIPHLVVNHDLSSHQH